METLPFLLVFASIFSHAYWNYLIKSSDNKHIFTGLSKLTEIIIFAIPAIYFLFNSDFKIEFLILIIVASCITFLNYFFLSSAYKHGDLSMVYPVSRSSVIFLPILAYFLIGETIDSIGISAIVLILLGTSFMHMESFNRNGLKTIIKNISSRGSVFALLAAFTVALYTLWDKISVTKMNPIAYFYLYTFLIAVVYNTFNFSKFSRSEIKYEWNKNKNRIIRVGFFNSFTYILVLIALTMSKASYVGGLRQLSIVVGVFFGYKLLGEKLNTAKIIGIVLSITGAFLIYFSN